MTANGARVTLVCNDCKRKRSGTPADAHRHGCDVCGGQLAIVRYRPQARRRR